MSIFVGILLLNFVCINVKLFRSKIPLISDKVGVTVLKSKDYLNIFHEIKNSITLVNGSLQLVAKKHPEVCDFDYWNEAMCEIDFLKNMVTQLSSARLCDHLNLMQVNIYSFMHQIGSSIRALSWDDFACYFTFEENLPLIEMDPQLIKQAVINIIKNAYEAMNTVGSVDVYIQYKDECLQIAIADHGGGLDPAIAGNIFDPFITSKTGGSGLGLVITRQIIESHHGTLDCASRPGDGCTFTISLPLKQS